MNITVTIWNLLKQSNKLQAVAQIFNDKEVSPDDTFKAGCTAFHIWFGSLSEEETLNQYRYTLFKRAVSKSATDLRMLCPTEGAARQHSYRVYVQVQAWLGNNLPITEWGWKKTAGVYLPICTTEPPAPDELLKKLFCNCKQGCKSGCGCRKLGELVKKKLSVRVC